MKNIIRIALALVVLAVGFVSTAPTKGIEARTIESSAAKLCPLINCIPEMVLDPKTCRCVHRP